jgi:hypothetical protein
MNDEVLAYGHQMTNGWGGRGLEASVVWLQAKAVSPLRSATAVQNRERPAKRLANREAADWWLAPDAGIDRWRAGKPFALLYRGGRQTLS